ncbi:MAG TPA: HAMP domain-containing sensor histidine kinase [Anaerolineae bacterium]|nr:HAMP domain-containing sensor histidine kinase [Anaerolineae bacterium]HOQ99438.1 HAMP domain-containing sensor histidine kinase [Anaerolineae bacterium]HPL27743.1 HAMP domain-containing sensor histidine kinase [Anaerolineae bacterium]
MKRYALTLLPLALGLALAVALQAGLAPNPILYARADAGTLLWLTGLAASLLWAGGLALWTLAARRAAEARTREQAASAEAHRRFVRRLDHELKNPLTAIRAGLANVAALPGDAALASVRAQVDRLARLTGDLRKLAELEAQPLEEEKVDLGELLGELAAAAEERPDAAERRLHLTLPQAPWPLPHVLGDRDLLFLALHNLLDNACKYSRPGDTVEIRAFEDGAWVAVEVADTGPGIAEEDLPHLGEELYRGRAPSGVEGSGLGLALVRAIIARHGGTVTIRSRLGRGTAVTLRFPVAR